MLWSLERKQKQLYLIWIGNPHPSQASPGCSARPSSGRRAREVGCQQTQSFLHLNCKSLWPGVRLHRQAAVWIPVHLICDAFGSEPWRELGTGRDGPFPPSVMMPWLCCSCSRESKMLRANPSFLPIWDSKSCCVIDSMVVPSTKLPCFGDLKHHRW